MTNETLTPVAAEAIAKYSPTDAAIEKMRSEFLPIRVDGVEDRDGAKRAHDARMVVKGHRVAIEKTRVALKADALAFGRAVDSEAKRLTAMLEPIENHLREQEEIVTKEVERRRLAEEAARAEALRARMVELSKVRSSLIQADVERMDDAEFAETLAEARAEFERAQEAERLAAEQRRLEDERLAAERAELERQRMAAEAERRAQERELAEQRAAQEAESRRIAEERAAIEAEKAAAARAAEIKAAEERAAEQAREQARVEAERAEAERQRREAMRPTVEKLRALADQVEAMPVPDFDGAPDVRAALAQAAEAIRAIASR